MISKNFFQYYYVKKNYLENLKVLYVPWVFLFKQFKSTYLYYG